LSGKKGLAGGGVREEEDVRYPGSGNMMMSIAHHCEDGIKKGVDVR
jgi:hypothetical protein